MRRVIIDTDPAIGIPFRDVDDGIAIVLALKSPLLEIAGITITHGNVDHDSAYLACKRLMKITGDVKTPIYKGSKRPLNIAAPASSDAVEFIHDSLHSQNGDLTLLCIGPLTNLATVEKIYPGTLSKAHSIVIMGGAVNVRGNIPPFFRAEFNFWKDPVSASIVMKSNTDISLIPLDVTMKVVFGSSQFREIRDSADAFAQSLWKQSFSWYLLNSLLCFRDGFNPHDPLATVYLTNPELFSSEKMRISILENGPGKGASRKAAAGSEINVALDVDKEKFLRNVVATLKRNNPE